MQNLLAHFTSLSRFNPNRHGIPGVCLFYQAMLLWRYFSDYLHCLQYFFPSAIFFIILLNAGKQIVNPLGFEEVLRTASTAIDRIRVSLKPTASEKSPSALCTVQVTQASPCTLRKAVPGKIKAAGIWQRINFLIIYVAMLRHRIQTH